MHFIYCKSQRSVDSENQINYQRNVSGGSYRPPELIRVSDWKKVPGADAVNGYHAFSYCREQSQDVVNKKNGSCDYIWMERDYIIEHVKKCVDGVLFQRTIKKHAPFYTVIQQLCKDFQVEYLWYDMDNAWLNDRDMENKLQSIDDIRNGYRNARYTIAMVPEVHIHNPKENYEHQDIQYRTRTRNTIMNAIYKSRWMQRSWPLAEVMMSKRILILGIDVHMFQHSLHTTNIPTSIDDFSNLLLDYGETQERGSVNQVLKHAHFRTSVMQHSPYEMIISLACIFSSMFDDIKSIYSGDTITTLKNLYLHITINDLSILSFGSNLYTDGKIRQQTTIRDNYNLPSWAGIRGLHTMYYIASTTHRHLSYNIDYKMWMHIKTKYYWKISITQYDEGCFSPSNATTSNTITSRINYILSSRSNGESTDMTKADKTTILAEWLTNMKETTDCYMTHYHQRQQKGTETKFTQVRPLSLTEDCKECIILPILFKSYQPIHKKVDDTGVNCVIERFSPRYFLSVFCECSSSDSTTSRYKAIGIYYLGEEDNIVEPTFNWTHLIGREGLRPEKSPEEILSILFENDCHDVPKKFVIE